MAEHEKPWEPMSPPAVAQLFSTSSARWWIAGGYALELFAGRSWRRHDDIDVLILRRDHFAVRELLQEFECWAVDPPGRLRPWSLGEILPLAVHDIWCRRGAQDPWCLQLMIDESESEDWVSRRDRRIRRDLNSVGLMTAEGIPYLAPEILLYGKAKSPRSKDELDFAELLPMLSVARRRWLSTAIEIAYGKRHAWHDRLNR